MKLKSKFLKWSAGIPVAMLNKSTASFIGVKEYGRISLRTLTKYPKEISVPANIVEGLVRKNEVALSSEIKDILKLKKNQNIDVNIAETPESLNTIKKKLDGKKLSQEQTNLIIKEIVSNKLSKTEIALFVSSMYTQGMTIKETSFLTRSILKHGNLLNLKKKKIVDKHSIGGIPGNRTTPIIISICSSAGLTMPKTSSKAITSAAGTADTIETLAPVEFSMKELRKIIQKTNAFLVWGGGLDMVPADSKIIRVEKELKLDPEAQLLASIMSKKLAVGSNYILIDIPYGETAKVSLSKAKKLKNKFESLAKLFHKKVEIVLTKGDQPIGIGIGPVLEMMDVLEILDPKKQGPRDLRNKSLKLAGMILEMTNKSKKGKGLEKAKSILDSGEAFKKFKEIIHAQGGKLKKLNYAKFNHDLLSTKSGKIKKIDNKKINSIARIAGCPADKKAGMRIFVHKNEKVEKNEKMITLYSESDSRLQAAIRHYKKVSPILIE